MAKILILLCLLPVAVEAGLFKCQQADGSVSYQQTPCPESARQRELEPDRRPAGTVGSGSSDDYSVEAQLKRMEESKRTEQKERKKRRRTAKQQQDKDEDTGVGEDTADCARYRAQVAEWKRRNRGGYKTRDERDYQKNKLRYYEIKARDACGD